MAGPGGHAFPIPVLVSAGSWYIKIPSYWEGQVGAGQFDGVGAVRLMFSEPVQLIVAAPVKKNITPVPVTVGLPVHEKPPAPSMMYIPGAKVYVPLPPREIDE